MPTPFLGEIKLVGFNFAPPGWAFCDGQLLPISQNAALFSLLGTTYGGDGVATFALPNLQSRIPRQPSDPVAGPGITGGLEAVALTIVQLPTHVHAVNASAIAGTSSSPAGNLLAAPNAGALYSAEVSTDTETIMAPAAIANTGASLAHNNLQPYLAVAFIIALQGIFPVRN